MIKNAKGLRFFGSAHSFNDGVVADTTLVSLDNYTGVVAEDTANLQLTVRGGTRIRDVVRLLLDRGWAFRALPSHDAQSIGGILSTDVHGTGRDWGFVSEAVVRLKVIDATVVSTLASRRMTFFERLLVVWCCWCYFRSDCAGGT
jgi:FAD/FMN-containing dehydrogenase